MRVSYPFSALVGQSAMRHALMMAAVDPMIGGVLVLGDRGTGKSTAVRALAQLLPQQTYTRGCPYGCKAEEGLGPCAEGCPRPRTGKVPQAKRSVPVVDLPLGAGEDRVVGALDIERALAHGEKAFEPGLLAAANRGFLYIDEVNLLEDHIVDLLLDVAASGENLVEREGISVRHPARFVLVGSGNPEEGDLRPQLQDRFGLCVEVKTPTDLRDRVEVIRRRDAFDRDPDGFYADWKHKDGRLRGKIARASERLDDLDMPDHVLETAASLCIALGTDGLRGELTLMRAARAAAALEGRHAVTDADVCDVAPLVLSHRLRRDPLDETSAEVRVKRALEVCFDPA